MTDESGGQKWCPFDLLIDTQQYIMSSSARPLGSQVYKHV